MDSIEESKKEARAIVEAIYHDAIEVSVMCEKMYLLDVLDVIEDQELVGEIAIMYDEGKNEFALIEKNACCLSPLASMKLQRGQALSKFEIDVMRLFDLCDSDVSVGAAWATISSVASHEARERLKQVGGDVDIIRQSIDNYFLTHPQ